MLRPVPPHEGESRQIEKVHHRQYEDYHPDFTAQCFNDLSKVCNLIFCTQYKQHISDIYQVKTYQQQAIDGIRKFLISKGFHEKIASVFVQ